MSNFWKIFISVVVTIVVAGGGVFYLTQRQINSIRDDNQAKMDDLNKQIATLKSTASTTPTTTTAPATTSANVYTHKELKYSLTLPTGYIGVDKYDCEGGCNSNLTIAAKIADSSYSDAYVTLSFDATGNTLDQLVASYKKDNNDIIKESDITIGGVAAKKYEIGGMASGFHYLAASGKYNLEINQYPNTDANQKAVDSILSTFKFPQ